MLVDLGSALVQGSTVSSSIQQQAESLYKERDKVAIIVSSHLLAMQMRRVSGRASYRQFANRAEALDWLKTGETAQSAGDDR